MLTKKTAIQLNFLIIYFNTRVSYQNIQAHRETRRVLYAEEKWKEYLLAIRLYQDEREKT